MTRDDFSDEESDVNIWGNTKVFIEKDEEKREWRVFSETPPRQLLVTIPWSAALREWPHAKDYNVAVKTCMANLGLTEEEMNEEMAHEELRSMGVDLDSQKVEPVGDIADNVVPFPRRK